MEWQTIDSAPKDGTVVMVYSHAWRDPVPAIAKWNDYGEWEDFGGGATIWPAPTHWMPLPPLPPK